MSDMTGDTLLPGAFSTMTRREAQGRTEVVESAGTGAPRTPADFHAALAALPKGGMRRGYRIETVDRMIAQVARELERRARGEAPLLRAGDVHPDGVAVARPGYAVAPARALLAAASDALKV